MTALATTLASEPPKTWLITGVAGFIGSNLLEHLLSLGQTVVGLDNFSTGHQANLDSVRAHVPATRWHHFRLICGDIRSLDTCRQACVGVDYVLHHAALGSVPHSLTDPLDSHDVNLTGFLNMLVAARDAKVQRFVYATSSATYGDHPGLPQVETQIGQPLSPYAVHKYANELYAGVFARAYDFPSTGLRYFNIFGQRQDPNGAYAAVIPQWATRMIRGDTIFINGDGLTSRDFCFVDNVVHANLLAALSPRTSNAHGVFNIAGGTAITLNQLFDTLKTGLARLGIAYDAPPIYRAFRAGDVRHSCASIDQATNALGYTPLFHFEAGLQRALPWYIQNV